MIKRSGIKKSMLLLLGCIVLLTGCAEDKEINIEEEKQDIVLSGLSDDNDVESMPEENVSEFPEDMFIPDSTKAGLPEVSHFKDKYYFRKREEYSDTESEFFEYRNLPGELIISCDNRETAISCFIYAVEDKYYYQDFRGTAYKQDDSNLYVGDICPVTDSDIIIGKFIISYSIDELILSVGYFDDTSDGQEKILESGVYHYYYNMTEFEKESVAKMGNPVELTDYSDYRGTWIPVYPADVVVQGREIYTYMELEIDSDGKVSGCMSQYEGLSECSYAEFTGNIEDSGCVIEYDDDGYGHEGVLTITFYENGIGVYVDEGGEPNGHGFPTGHNYYMKQESK